ncbi:adenosylmethionine--8-amino-7-oxononanoate transaminase [Pedobacter sp. SYSU D00535]|uniref:adenosylmethionine--8-amino-7-oxononanoate transaminase n=1 Tax=Pedobacter sp. SYSU D00535 TaxID=2810308 RepID=UPI001A96064C|nr:adenosylmethionine--8-amino-7-oxononanoate transaminase [Pedobacter sp. SYSU D00535]
MAEKSLTERDKAIIWHPYTQMQTAPDPIAIVRGEGAYLIDDSGKKYIDAVSSWWVNLHGHSHPYIAERVSTQLKTLEHAIFAGFTHPPAVELAEGLLQILPKGQSKIFYSDNGSTAVEVALKMCFQYWSNRGEARKKVLAFKNSYHGDTFGAMAVSARSAFTAPFESFLFDVIYIDTPDETNLVRLKEEIATSAEEISAFIYEPLVQGSGGMLMYEASHLDELLAFCKENRIFAIADEVMTGFGRTGRLFASEYMSNQPDLVCLSKGLTGGTMALGVTSCTVEIFKAFLSDDKLKTLFHGHSFTANPIACAAALASLDLTLRPETMQSIQRIADRHRHFAEKLRGNKKLRSIRQTGTIIAFEWETNADTSYFNMLRDQLYAYFLADGIILRPLGNILYILPPYCISDEDLSFIYSKIEQALELF